MNDNIGIKALRNVGIKEDDAWNYVPIGCYEPALWGVEIGCTGNGSVLDIVLHPSAVSGEDGLSAMYGILLAYFRRVGFAMHGNVFDADELKNAQKNPEKYANLQVRVCGWNVYFVNLSKEEQDTFIRQAENV